MELLCRPRQKTQSGQIGIIVVLIMIVLLTIGLSLASRTTKQVALTTQESESTRVFNAAEVGVEQALSNLTFSGDTYTSSPILPAGTNATVTYTVNKQYQLQMQIFQGVSTPVQLTDSTHPTPPAQLHIDWAQESGCSLPGGAASLLVSIYSLDKTTTPQNVTVRYLTFEPCGRANNFSSAGVTTVVDANGYRNHVNFNLAANDILVRVKPVYNDTKLLIQPSSGQLPVQGYAIRSSGNNNNGTENRNVQVTRSLPAAPSILDYVLLSGTTIVK